MALSGLPTQCGVPCREAQASCEFAGAFWLAAQCARALEPVATLRVAAELGQSASMLYAGIIQHLEAALSAVCSDFRPEQYAKVTTPGRCYGHLHQWQQAQHDHDI